MAACAAPVKTDTNAQAAKLIDEQQARNIAEDFLSVNGLDWGIPVSVTTNSVEIVFVYPPKVLLDGSFDLGNRTFSIDRKSGEVLLPAIESSTAPVPTNIINSDQ